MLPSLRSSAATLLITSILVLAFTSPVRAADRAEVAIVNAEQGERDFAQRRYDEAYASFAKANDALPAPTVVVRMGDCKRELGELVAARVHDQRAASWQLPTPAPPPWSAAKERAARELEAIDKRVPTLDVRVAGASDATLEIDGKPVSSERLRLDPGEHVVTARAGDAQATRTVNLAEGAHETVELAFDDADQAGPPHVTVPSIVAYAVAGAALLVGIGTGAATLVEAADLKSRCQPDNHCPAADADQADRARSLATAATVSFVVAGIAAAAGVGLMWLPDPAVAVRVEPTGVSVRF